MYAFREDAVDHDSYHRWLLGSVAGDEAYAVSDLILSGFVRVVTHPRAHVEPTPLKPALEFADEYRNRSNAVCVAPGPRHWEVFSRLATQVAAKGNLVADAYLAALAIETGSEWITTDRDFARFPGLRWRHPLAA